MRLGVGSGNPVKRAAVERAVDGVLDGARVEAVPVASGVAEQPTGHAETIAGAENRARTVLAESDSDLGVGLEGGVADFDGTDGLFLVMWAAVTDGDRMGHGAGPSVRLPDSVAERIRDGDELGPVMDALLGEDDVAKNQGAAGAFTAGKVDREEALATAVAGAMAPFVTGFY
jgi:inosine/xanthosine triphosphatase